MDSYLVAYDICNPKRLRKVAQTCEDFGLRRQYSVFFCRLTAANLVRLKSRLYDIINLQEVHTYNLFHLLKKNLPSYPYVAYERALPGPLGGLVTLSRYPLEKVQFTPFTYPKQMKHALLYASKLIHKKGTLVAKIQGKALLICNTHLIPNRQGNWSRENKLYQAHEKQLEELSNLIAQAAHKENYVVVSGDFNIPKSSDLYTHFLDISHAKDIFAADDTPTFHAEFLPSGKKAQRIDYIFLYPEEATISIHASSLLFQNKVMLPNGKTAYLSDHIGLMAEFELFPGSLDLVQ